MPPLNHNVYEAIAAAGMQAPDIPVRSIEYYAQCGEDVIVLALLRAVALREGLDLSRERYLEIGANHPVATNATWLLHRALGMTGVLVEANPRLLGPLRAHRPGDEILHAAVHVGEGDSIELYVSNQNELSSLDRDFVLQWRDGVVGEREVVTVPAIRVDDLLARHFPDRPPAFVSIDIEGLDLAVLRDLDFARFRPLVVQAEPSDHHHPGNTEAIARFLGSVGYVVVARTEVNLISIDAARLGLSGPAAFDEESGRRMVEAARRAATERDLRLAAREEAIAGREREIAERDAALARAAATLQDVTASLTAARNETAAARAQAARLEGQVAGLEGEVARLAAEAGRLEAEAAARRAEAAELAALRDRMLGSTSWRATAPLRAGMRLLRGGG
ncbi:FkbM family methyltransferase [Falsiroseomonas sp. CW058]|uniref:FkbM family methyltransferase n=1 Tax=Falsiroseomonas sp. CW058 TaxID=3388664 RepID=UPI003D314FD1